MGILTLSIPHKNLHNPRGSSQKWKVESKMGYGL